MILSPIRDRDMLHATATPRPPLQTPGLARNGLPGGGGGDGRQVTVSPGGGGGRRQRWETGDVSVGWDCP